MISGGKGLLKPRVWNEGSTLCSMYIFRSMCADVEDRLSDLTEFNEKMGPVFKMHDGPRITRVSRVTRRLSLNDLPQFANVIKGDISIVGPGPRSRGRLRSTPDISASACWSSPASPATGRPGATAAPSPSTRGSTSAFYLSASAGFSPTSS